MQFTTTTMSRLTWIATTASREGRRFTRSFSSSRRIPSTRGGLRLFIESEQFFNGRFEDKVAEVHSALRGVESEEAMERLVALEQDGRTEIVIHVNKLKEGWDVTNLYTIVPLPGISLGHLTEQTLGRGLRLPYGTRVSRGDNDDFAAVDRLTVIAHERFDELIQKAKEPGSIVMKEIVIGEGGDVSTEGATLVVASRWLKPSSSATRRRWTGFLPKAAPAAAFTNPQERKGGRAYPGRDPPIRTAAGRHRGLAQAGSARADFPGSP